MTHSWNDLIRRTPPQTGPDPLAEACAQALTTPAGKRMMTLLHERFIDHVMTGTPDKRALLQHEAKRQIVRELEELTARGLEALKKDKTV